MYNSNITTPEVKISLLKEAIRQEVDHRESQMQSSRKTVALVQDWDDSELPKGSHLSVNPGSIFIRIPWGVENLRLVRKMMGKGWKKTGKYESPSGSLSLYFSLTVTTKMGDEEEEKEYYSLTVAMDPDSLPEGSCKKILVEEKEEIVIRKVYKIVCDDGVETMEVVE